MRITLKADGTIRTDVKSRDFWTFDPLHDEWRKLESKRLTINLLNARSQIGRYVGVGTYPASHITLSVPSEAKEGTGLEVTLNLFLPTCIGKIQDGDRVRDWSWDDRPISVDMLLSENGRELIITVHSDTHVDTEGAGATAAPPARKELVVERTGPGLLLHAVNAPLTEVADAVSDASGLKLAVAAGLQRRLTASLPPMPADQLLRMICRTLCLQLSELEGVHYIGEGTAEDITDYPTATSRRVRLNSLSVDAAIAMLPTFALRHVKADADSNALIVYGPTEFLDKVESDLALIDRPSKQVRVKALVAQIADTTSSTRVLSSLLDAGEGFVEMAPLDGRLRVGVLDVPLEHVRVQLQALASRGLARLQAQPTTTVANGEETKLFVGTQQFYGYLADRWYGQELVLNRVDVGARIIARPWTGDGEHITVGFEVSADSVISKDTQGIPLVARQGTSGSLRLRSGDTLIFGGLRLTNETDTVHTIRPLRQAFIPAAVGSDRDRVREDLDVLVCLTVQAVDAADALPAPPDGLDTQPARPLARAPVGEERNRDHDPS